ncbi:FadR/GntR family transcriptional regulator [Plantibacter sp. Mn2098]|uniref:FadR/GntR family transcriptional regulator n=1 Tax=Plantibacter sp. Mn2098 TaxID=3395266 RepID=UPI003BEA0873
MSLEPANRAPMTAEVIDRLREMIGAGLWAVGERIPTERDLCAQLKVGRGTVREAVRALAYAGMLDVRQGDGTYVASLSELAGPIRRLRAAADGLHDLLEVRVALDVQAARLAAARRTGDDLERLQRIVSLRASAASDRDSWIEADWEFHLAVAQSSHNDLLVSLYRSLEPLLRADMIAAWPLDGFAADSIDGHTDLVEAIERGDQDRAGQCAQQNLDRTSDWARGLD